MTTQMNFGPEWMRGSVPSRLPNTRETKDFYEYQPTINKQYHQYVSVTESAPSPLSFLDQFDDIKNISNHVDTSAEEDMPSWSHVDRNSLGTFDSNGVFRPEPTSPVKNSFFTVNELQHRFLTPVAVEPKLSHFENFYSEIVASSSDKKTYEWYYCDPSGIVRGPFTSYEMQAWYKAGYFDPYLAVKREDAHGFETLSNLINRVGDVQKPFLASWPQKSQKPLSPASHIVNYSSDETIGFPGVHFSNYHQPKEETSIEHEFLYDKQQLNYSFMPSWNNKFPIQNKKEEIPFDINESKMQQAQSQQQYINMLRHNQQQHLLLQQKLILEQQQQQHMFQRDLILNSHPPVPKTEEQTFSQKLFPDQSSNKTEEPTYTQEKIETEVNDKLTKSFSNLHVDQTSLEKETQKKVETINNAHTRSNTWSSLNTNGSSMILTPSQSTHIQSSEQKANKPRQKHVSMTASIPPRRIQSETVTQKKPSDDFIKWCKLSLRDLNPGVNGEEILQMLLSFPVDNSYSEIIQDIIYANSASLDGRRFAQDFMTRRKEDMEGKKLNIPLPKSTHTPSEFKVVTKKGKKRH